MFQPNLIMDVGMHVGHDTRFYLAKGFDVVAIEANPRLVEAAEIEFADAIRAGRLRIFGVAIAEAAGEVDFAIADANDELSTTSEPEIRRAEEHGITFRRVTVPAVPLGDVLRAVGVPYYLKVDIEGLDLVCVRALGDFAVRPRYVSIESAIASAERSWGFDRIFDELAELRTLGYHSFKYVNQMRRQRLPDVPREGTAVGQPPIGPVGHASGGFGDEAPGRWLTVEQALVRGWTLRVQHELGGNRGRWAGMPTGVLYRGVRSRILRRPTGFFGLHARL